jgi:fructan beta-fructosidase
LGNASFSQASNWLAGRELKSELLEVEMDFAVEKSSGDFGIKIASGATEETVVRLSKDGRLSLDRTHSGRTDFHRKFPGVHEAKLSVRNGVASLHLFLDTSSIEVFANEGEAVLTDLILPTGDKRRLELVSDGQQPRVMQIRLWELKSAWK